MSLTQPYECSINMFAPGQARVLERLCQQHASRTAEHQIPAICVVSFVLRTARANALDRATAPLETRRRDFGVPLPAGRNDDRSSPSSSVSTSASERASAGLRAGASDRSIVDVRTSGRNSAGIGTDLPQGCVSRFALVK